MNLNNLENIKLRNRSLNIFFFIMKCLVKYIQRTVFEYYHKYIHASLILALLKVILKSNTMLHNSFFSVHCYISHLSDSSSADWCRTTWEQLQFERKPVSLKEVL
jgi:hypothetical protein